MKLAWVAALIPLAACGRADFAPVPLAVLECGAAPPSFPIDPTVQEIAATATTNGYAAFTTDAQGAITGNTFELSPTDPTHTLTPGVTVPGLATGADNRQIGAFASGDAIELAIPEGPAGAPTGFTRIPLTAKLAPSGAENVVTGWTAQAGSVAFTTAGLGVHLQQTTGMASPTVEASTAATDGAPSTPVTLKQSSDQVAGATIIAAGDQFLLTWIATATGDVFAQLFTTGLQPASGAVQITTPTNNGAKMARAAFANGEAVFVWTRKDPSGADQAWFNVLDTHQASKASGMLSPDANIGAVIAGDADFLAAWQGQTAIGAARIAFDGTVQDATITSNGGAPLNGDGFIAAWDLVTHNGQPALVWGEAATDGSKRLWVNPLCGSP